jgi:hypothetical protein
MTGIMSSLKNNVNIINGMGNNQPEKVLFRQKITAFAYIDSR